MLLIIGGGQLPNMSPRQVESPPINSNIDFRLVPPELMPVNPIESVPNSVQMYENHMEVCI